MTMATHATKAKKATKATTQTVEIATGRRLPGRAVLLGLVAFVVIFLDFESASLTAFVQSDGTQFDAKQAIPHMEQELGKMQQYQLERQWGDYKRRTNETDISISAASGPEEIVIEDQDSHHDSGPHGNATDPGTSEPIAPLASPENITVEEIIVEPANTTNVASHNTRTNRTKAEWLNTTAVAEQIVIASADQCFPHNTRDWLHGNRLSNAAYNLTDDFVFRQILIQNRLHPEVLHDLSSDTICHPDSTFRNPSTDWDIKNEKLIEEWEFRLIYMAIHEHHHAPAKAEAEARQACARELKISKMDYECPSSKFLVSNIADSGLGSAFRIGAVNTILMGIATNRVSVFVNNFSGGPTFLSKSSQLSSCPRGDVQCFYLPTTPCTLLAEDLKNATVLPEVDARDLRRQGKLDQPEYVNASILVVQPRLNPPKEWSIQTKIQARLHEIALNLIDDIRESASNEQIRVLEAAAARIQLDNATIAYGTKPENATEYIYGNRYTKTAHAALMYLMRPNANYQRLTNAMVANIVPDDIDHSLSIGLPVRGSDKCKSESICYGFDRYMKLMQLMWDGEVKGPEGSKGSIILTTEDPKILDARQAYLANESFPFRFIINDKDILQGSGAPKSFKHRADSIMLASIVSIKLQLQAKYVVGNCCSNFHTMLFDFVNAGCGAVPESRAMCLQEHPDPQFHICCGWTKTEECDRIRDAEAEERRKRESKEKKEASGSN